MIKTFKFGTKVKVTSRFYNNIVGTIIHSETFGDKTIYTIRVEINSSVLHHSYVDIKENATFVELIK